MTLFQGKKIQIFVLYVIESLIPVYQVLGIELLRLFLQYFKLIHQLLFESENTIKLIIS